MIWSGKLRMEFENKGSKPIILINPSLSFGTGLSKVEFYFSGTSRKEGYKKLENALGFTKVIQASEEQRAALRSLSDLFDANQPPDNLVVILKPGETLQFEEPLEISQKYAFLEAKSLIGERGVSWEGSTGWYTEGEWGDYVRQLGLPLGRADQIKLTYEFPVTLFSDAADLFDKLNNRWKKYGQLPLDHSGGYVIVSEPILPKQAYEKIGWPEDSGPGLKRVDPF